MFARLVGDVVETMPDGSVVFDVGGVGYEVFVPFGRVTGQAITLHIHTHVREDALQLYGFLTMEDKLAFRELLNVNSVGPKLALAILSHLSAKELRDAVVREDRNAFKGISGVGKKIVERLVLELKDKLVFVTGTAAAPAPVRPTASHPFGAVTAILVTMGFRPDQAERAVATLPAEQAGRPTQELVRDALAAMA